MSRVVPEDAFDTLRRDPTDIVSADESLHILRERLTNASGIIIDYYNYAHRLDTDHALELLLAERNERAIDAKHTVYEGLRLHKEDSDQPADSLAIDEGL